MKKIIILSLFALSLINVQVKAQASTPYIGQIAYVTFNYAPRGWAECNGQLLPINQNQTLFALLGTQYGGDGRVNFGLPNIQSRVVISDGQGPGLSPYTEGQTGGQETVTLTVNEMPAHSHLIKGVAADGNTSVATGNLPANTKTLDPEYSTAAGDTDMGVGMVTAAGGSQPHENRSPFLVLKCIIALQGYFPPRN